MTRYIAVGSTNPIKISAAEMAFARLMPDQEMVVTGHDVPSGVSNQPMSHEEAISGARNRANSAWKVAQADIGIGLESGIEQIEGLWFTTGWVVIVDAHGHESLACTMMKLVPQRMIELVKAGTELGYATDAVFGTEDSKCTTGLIGLLTGNILTRESVYRDTIVAAWSSLRFPELYFD